MEKVGFRVGDLVGYIYIDYVMHRSSNVIYSLQISYTSSYFICWLVPCIARIDVYEKKILMGIELGTSCFQFTTLTTKSLMFLMTCDYFNDMHST